MLCRQRLLTEHMADVFCAIKTLRAQRPGMVENLVRDSLCSVYHIVIMLIGSVCVHSQDTGRNNGPSRQIF